MATLPQVCCLLGPPERKDALAAIQRTIGLIRRRYALDAVDIAKSLKNEDGSIPSADRIERAERGENLLTFDMICQLAYLYRDCADPIRRLLEPAATGEPTTLEDRLQRAEQEILHVRRELASLTEGNN